MGTTYVVRRTGSWVDLAILIIFLAGLIFLIAGCLFRRYPSGRRFFARKEKTFLERVLELRGVVFILGLITGNGKNRLYRVYQRFLKRMTADLTVEQLLIYKISAALLFSVIITAVRATNLSAVSLEKAAKLGRTFSIPIVQAVSSETARENIELYKAVLRGLKEQNLNKKADDAKRLEAIVNIMRKAGVPAGEQLVFKARQLLELVKSVENTSWIDVRFIVLLLYASFLPEFILIFKRIIYKTRYQSEVIKLENIFQLLGSMRTCRTIHIIEEMTEASKVYKSYLVRFKDMFRVDREEAIRYLREEVKDKDFRRLVECIRIYSTVDKRIAMEVLERNIRHREEEGVLTSEENADMIEIVAFISIVPVLWQMTQLMLMPMVDIINKGFTGI